MLDAINITELEQEKTNNPMERLKLVADQVIESLPLPQRMLVQSYLNSYQRQAASNQPADEDIFFALEKIREVIDFVQYGGDPTY